MNNEIELQEIFFLKKNEPETKYKIVWTVQRVKELSFHTR